MLRAFAILFTLAALQRPDPYTLLRQDLRSLFAVDSVDHAQWAVNVTSLRTGELLYRENARKFMVPASNQKLLITAAAAERLGWDFRFTTRILSTASVDPQGTLNGDLIIVGDGDPTINPRHPERWQIFDRWAETLREQGVRIISGHVIGDDNAFAEPGWGVGWAWDNLAYGYGAPVSALQYNENQVELLVGPGMTAGARAIISTSPLGSGLFVDHGVDTVAAGERTSVDISRIPGTPFLVVRGHVAADAKPLTLTASVDNPTRLYLNAFREALGRHGIFVAGTMMDIDDLREPPDMSKASEIIVDRSPPLSEIIDVTLKWSRNIYAESLLFAMAPLAKEATPNEPATSARGLEAVAETLTRLGVVADSYLARDGSGLSRYDYVTADTLTWLLTYLWMNPAHADLFRASLPVAGTSGTLAERMKGTPAEGRVWAKTGSLSNMRALSGYVVTVAGEPLVFSIIFNDFRVSNADVDAIVDKALVRLAQFER